MARGDQQQREGLIQRLLALRPNERQAVVWSFLYFFSILSSYYLLRPVREEMAILGGTENIPWLFLGTFVTMLAAVPVFGWITSRHSRAQFLPWVYLFFAANLGLLFAAFKTPWGDGPWVARAFFVWLSVFNLFIVSVFWSFMADLYSKEQARRLFGMIAGGGSAGALAGPAVTAVLAQSIGYQNLLLISIALLVFAVLCITQLRAWARRQPDLPARSAEKPMGGSWFEAFPIVARSPYLLGIAVVMVLGNFTGTVLYIYQAEIVAQAFDDSNTRTTVFAGIDLAVNILAFIFQVGVARWSIQRLGAGLTLSLMPAISIAGFVLLALFPSLAVLVVFQVLRRSMNYGLTQPAKELLFTVVPVNAKYKAKNFIDTVVYRGGDAFSAQTVRLMQVAGAGLGAIAGICTLLSVVWIVIAMTLGRDYGKRYADDRIELDSRGGSVPA